MKECSFFITLILVGVNILSISATEKDICEKCLKIEDCGMFIFMNKEEQQKWSEVASCDVPNNNEQTGPFGFSSKAKGDYVCCPNKSLWGTDILNGKNNSNTLDNNPKVSVPTSATPKIRLNNPGGSYQNPNIGPGYNSNPDQGIFIPNPGEGNIYENSLNGINNQGYPQNPIELEYPNQGNTNSNPGPYYPNSNNQMNGNGNPLGINNGNGNPYGVNNGNGNPYGGNNVNGNPYGINNGNNNPYGVNNGNGNPYGVNNGNNNPYGVNNGNGNSYDVVDLEKQCALTSGLLPDPRTGCCGKDMSDFDTITDLQSILNMYAPSNTNNNWSRQPQAVYPSSPFYRQRIKRFADNETDFMLEDRIAGGKETELDQFPWTVLLRLTFDYGNRRAAYNCGGSLISPKYVLTAGHCVYEKAARVTDVEVTLAEYDKRTFPRDCKASLGEKKKCIDNVLMHAENIILHQDYDDERLHNDIALVRLRGYAPYTRFIRPICLPDINIDVSDFANLPLAVAGWGRNGRYNSDIKQSTVVRLISHGECKESYPSLSNAQLCAVGRTGEDTCKGDSGGPLMMLYRGSYYIVGIVSGKRADSPCGTRVPSLYTNVFNYVPWITRHISD